MSNSPKVVLQAIVKETVKQIKHDLEEGLVKEFMEQAEATIRPRIREIVAKIDVKQFSMAANITHFGDDLRILLHLNDSPKVTELGEDL